jgi:hypothetical protein
VVATKSARLMMRFTSIRTRSSIQKGPKTAAILLGSWRIGQAK